MGNKIRYWEKHQELDKFNYDRATSNHIAAVSIIAAVWIGIMGISILLQNINIIYWVSGLFLIVLIISSVVYIRRTNSADSHFRIREAMLRIWYQKTKVNTDLLDSQFEEIEKEYKRKMSNKDLENLAKKVLKKK